MRILLPDWVMAKRMAEGYAEDGVAATHGYDDNTGQWFVDIDDEEYDLYQKWLREEHRWVLRYYSGDWDGVNIQGSVPGEPLPHETRLSLYLVDVECDTARGFKVTSSLKDLLERKCGSMFIGSTCNICGRKSKVVLRWEGRPK